MALSKCPLSINELDHIFAYCDPESMLKFALCHITLWKRFSEYIDVAIHSVSMKNMCKLGSSYCLRYGIHNKMIHDWNCGLSGACEGGHKNIVHLMIEKGATDWNWGFYCACIGGNMDMVRLMIEKGATNWNRGMYIACHGGHTDIVQLMIEKGANIWNEGLYYACEGGQIGAIRLMIEKGATRCAKCDKSIKDHLK